MSDIKLVRPYSVSIAEAKARVQKVADALAVEHHLKSEWHGDTVRFARSGLHGEMHVTDSEIRLLVKLGPLMKPLRARLIRRIEDKFERLFREAKAGAHAINPHKKTAPPAR